MIVAIEVQNAPAQCTNEGVSYDSKAGSASADPRAISDPLTASGREKFCRANFRPGCTVKDGFNLHTAMLILTTMKSCSPVTVVNVGYRSTNFWVVSAGQTRVMFDLGWPGMFGAMRANLKRMDIPLSEIKYGLASHYHIDHAGGAQDLKHCGMCLIVTPEQLDWIPAMQRWIKPVDHYTPITTDDNLVVTTEKSRRLLATLGIAGEIVHTPGHSADSVSLVLDSGIAFTGDLPPMSRLALEDPHVLAESWQKLRDRGVTTVYGAHSPPLPIEAA